MGTGQNIRISIIVGSVMTAGVGVQAAPLSIRSTGQPASAIAGADQGPCSLGGLQVWRMYSWRAASARRGSASPKKIAAVPDAATDAAPAVPTGTARPSSPEMLKRGPTSAVQPAAGQADLRQRVSNFMTGLFANWSSPNPQMLESMGDVYDDVVNYYGKIVSREAVIEDKQRFAARWLQRAYAISPGTLVVRCDDGSLVCAVSGITDWAGAKNARRATGAAGFYYVVRAGNDGLLKITEETSKVVRRRMSEGQAPADPQRVQASCAADGATALRENVVCRN
jgi:hypothetical protein